MAVIRSATAVPGASIAGQELRIAVITSGTDVFEDRDLVDRFCLPELRRYSRARNLSFSEVALVTGAETSRELTANRVASVLDTIRRDRPIVIFLLGSVRGVSVPERVLLSRGLLTRHPWLEHVAGAGLSLAEIALFEGILDNPLMSDRLIVSIRQPAVRGREARRAAEPLAQLAARIHNDGISTISGYDDRRALADRIISDLTTMIDRTVPASTTPSPIEQVRRAQEAFAASRRQAYVEVSNYSAALDAHIASDSAPLAVVGATGSGKSALLANWITQYRANHPDAFLIAQYAGASGSDSDHLALLRQIMIEIRERYSLTEEVPSTPREIVAEMPIWLARVQHERLVLVLDGLDQLAPASRDLEWLPRYIPPQVRLIGSASEALTVDALRSRGWEQLRLKPLTLSERRSVTKEFLGERSRRLTGEQLRRVTNDSSSANPLFLRIRLEELRAHGPAGRLNERIDSFLDAGDLDKLFDRVLERVERGHDTDLVREVMTLLWASRRGLTAHDLEVLLRTKAGGLADLLSSLDFHLISRDGLLTFFHECMRQAVATRYGLNDEAESKATHRRLARHFATQPMSRARASEEPWQLLRAGNKKKLRECISSIDMFMELSREETEYELLGYWHALGPVEAMADAYAKNFAEHEKTGANTIPMALMLDRLGRFLFHAGMYERAEPLMARAVSLSQNEIGADDPRAMEIAKHHVQILLELGRYTESAERCRNMIDALAPAHGDAHPVIIDALTMLADAQHYLGQLAEAEITARRAVSACEKIYGPEHTALAEALFNLAAIVRDRMEYSLSESLIRRVLAIDEKVHGPNHPTTATSRGDLGYLLFITRRFDEAEGFLKQALKIREDVLGPDHAHTGQSYHQLGSFYKDLEQFDASEKYFSSAARVFERSFGESHPNVAATLGSLAAVVLSKGNLVDAESLGRRAVAIAGETLGDDHASTMQAIQNLGRILSVAGKLDEAEGHLQRAFEWFTRALGAEHNNTSTAALHLAEALRMRRDYDGAAALIKNAIASIEKAKGRHHIDTAKSTLQLARLELERGDTNEAASYCRQTIDILNALGVSDNAIKRSARQLLASLEANEDAALSAAS